MVQGSNPCAGTSDFEYESGLGGAWARRQTAVKQPYYCQNYCQGAKMSSRMPAQKRRGSGEGTIYQRADGLWAAQLRLPTGERRTLYSSKKSDVQAKLQALRRGADDGLLPSPESHIRVDQFLERWLDAIRSSVRQSTYVSYDLNARRLNK